MIQPKFGVPDGTYDLNIGKSFNKSSKNRQEYHTLRYDFKPKSVNAEQEAYITMNENSDDVHIAFANDTSDSLTMYKGASKLLKDGKECLLIFDEDRGELRLEKVMTNLNVKQTRGGSDEVEQAIQGQIEQQRRPRKPLKRAQNSPPNKTEEKMLSPAKPSPPRNKSKPPKDNDYAIMSSSTSDDEGEDGEILDETQEQTPSSGKSVVQDEQSNQSGGINGKRYSFNLSSRSASPSPSVSTSSSDDDFAAELERRINAASASPEPAETTTNDDGDMPDLFGTEPTNQATTPEKPPKSSSSITNRCQLTMDLALSDTSDEDD